MYPTPIKCYNDKYRCNGKGGTTASSVPNKVVFRLVVDKELWSEDSNNFPESLIVSTNKSCSRQELKLFIPDGIDTDH